jgi:Sulfotransferase domain
VQRWLTGFMPNLLIIGAAKAGTTSLHAYLGLHPAISMSRMKELQLFSSRYWEERLESYRLQFPVRTFVRGEASPSYSMDPVLPDVPRRAHVTVPDARIIYMVRDPIPRLLAHYREFVSVREEERSFEAAMADFDQPTNVYVMTSRYSHQLDRWREYYDDARILVVEQHELLAQRRETLRRVFRFLEVDEDFWTPEFDRLHNTRELKLRPTDFGVWLHDRGGYVPAVRTVARLPERVGAPFRRVLGTEIPKARLDDALRAELEALLGEDAARLRAHTGKALDHWSV